MSKTRRHRLRWNPPSTHARTLMKKKCGKKCFLGPKNSFPICSAGTCKRNKNGVHAAYVRAREWASKTKKSKYARIASRAKKIYKRM
jgi:hypothetical protein